MVTLESAVRAYLPYLHLRSEIYQTAVTLKQQASVYFTLCAL